MLIAFNKTQTIGAAHTDRAVVFDSSEDCFVSIYASSAGAPGASLTINLLERSAAVPGQPMPAIITSVVDLTMPATQLAAALAFPTGCILEARSFGIMDVKITISAITGPNASPSATPIR